MSDPAAMDQGLTGMLPNGVFADEPASPGSGEGDDVQSVDVEREGEGDPGPERIEPGQG